MSDRQLLVDQIIRHEGVRLKPYLDTVGKTTIGVGRNLSDVGVSEAEAMLLLEHDLDAVIADMATFAWFPLLDPVRQRAVVNVRFNVGPSGFRGFARFIHAMAIAGFVDAARELRNSKAATQAPMRYKELAAMIETGTE